MGLEQQQEERKLGTNDERSLDRTLGEEVKQWRIKTEIWDKRRKICRNKRKMD